MLSVLGFRMTCSDSGGAGSGKHAGHESESGAWSTAVIKVGLLILGMGLILALSSSARGQEPTGMPAASTLLSEYEPTSKTRLPGRLIHSRIGW